MILCPYGVATALINHSKEKANAKLVWSEKTTRRPEWLRQHPSQWIHELKAGLAFDVVALRDIQRYVQSNFDESERLLICVSGKTKKFAANTRLLIAALSGNRYISN